MSIAGTVELREDLEPGLTVAVFVDPVESAQAAGLRYVTDDQPGIRRRKRGKGFSYIDPQGRTVREPRELERIRKLAIPPAWTDVWICSRPNGHLQATGRDARGRKQYRYHPDWRNVRDETKFGRLVAFGEALPRIRERIERDLALQGLPREKVLATVIKLLETTLIRIGNKEYVRQNNSFGLTTLRDRHVDVSGSTLRFQFRGKSGKEQSVEIQDRRLARIVKQCRELPGHRLFQYLDEEDVRQSVSSEDVNVYLRETTGEDFTAKDFRTWGGTVLALSALRDRGACETAKEASKAVVEAVKQVAGGLGNRPAICRKYYVHPAVIEAFLEGSLPRAREGESPEDADPLRLEEAQLLALLKERNGRPSPPGPSSPAPSLPTSPGEEGEKQRENKESV
ncbi:MAG TPA: DNA topoisomerase IB [Thermoanaerobaculia bacterium]|jgi:DNA topoisomerase-1|nr:DNA topoisomerase IB [Thermoanaerobaculia bacterium]